MIELFYYRILLVYTSLDLENAISKYFQLYERYVSRNATVDVLTTLCRDTNRLHMGTSDPNMVSLQTYTATLNILIEQNKISA